MTGWLIGSGCVLAIVGGPLGFRRLLRWRHEQAQRGRHWPGYEPDDLADREWYGHESMIWAEERHWETVTAVDDHGRILETEPTAFLPAPTEAEVAASRAAHGYIPELDTDPGPGVVAPSHGPPPGPVTSSESDWEAPPVAKPWPEETGASVGREGALTGAFLPACAPEGTWLDAQLEDLYAWVRKQLEAA